MRKSARDLLDGPRLRRAYLKANAASSASGLIYDADAVLLTLDCSLRTVLLAQTAPYTDLWLYEI
jgi:hypothetical protein